jgi:hypothetical protein
MTNNEIAVQPTLMTKEEIVAELKQNHLTIDKMVNEEIVTLDQDEYDTTIEAWADAFLIKQNQQLQAEAEAQAKATAKAAAQAKLAALGLTVEDLQALGL